MYSVGDNEVASYVFKCDMGFPNDKSAENHQIDAYWPNVGYQYFKNMELVGIGSALGDRPVAHPRPRRPLRDRRVDQLRMMDNAGKSITLWGSAEDTVGITKDLQGNTWNIAGALPASETVIRAGRPRTTLMTSGTILAMSRSM